MTIPTVIGQSFDGSPVEIAPGGKPKVVMFLAHWCPHCQAEVPRLQEWLDTNGVPTDVDFFAVATGTTDTRGNFPPGNWLRREAWSVRTLVDDEQGTAATAFGLSGFPFFVVVDAQGAVVTRVSGELSVDQWDQLLEAARSGGGGVSGEGPQSPR
jgi:thiol-disulfide isomerase/thioredoxin